MFRNDEVISRRIARTWFGIALLLGAILLAVRVTAGSRHGIDPAAIIVGTWFFAFMTYRIARDVRPAPSDPDRLACASLIVPALGILTVLPLTLHLPFFALAGALDSFGGWARISLLFTAPTTVVAATLISIRAIMLAEGRPVKGVLKPWAIYGLGIAVIGPLWALVVPGVLVAITALPFVTLIDYMETLVARERELANIGELPEARLRSAA